MSGTALPQSNSETTKATTSDESSKPAAVPSEGQKKELEEDDEFEDFPVEDWGDDEKVGDVAHLWEESWDDDGNDEDFAKLLQEEINKVEGNK